ncbi:P-loop containing nucleoside triphosphate hydrolase protein [Roridomyces roridus]|uniref:Structural maintenance of chromosomes protein 5 n=1 Tax=Roridomyces roridus TaxID=1738132 RepID=A0AAD7BF54_9AGAR|nr:P-loop containing nucleoside triphosphate hydrolase protein [Roridomyces roridus]
MVRTVTTSDEDASPRPRKTNTKIKAEKGKAKAREPEDGGSPKGAKRSRVNEEGDSIARDEEEAEGQDEEQGEQAEPVTRIKTLPRGKDGYIPGSIVRIHLRDFVTYDEVEFRPGPYLNMIIGPNGTGKSSIACAICLGLNFPPATLGRATEISAFVKNTAKTAHIEIELKGAEGEKNLVIRRNLTAGSRTSTFTLNGQQASGKEVSARVAKLNVQVGNLCSFLPQDKVSAFAAMTPIELLRETQRAAGDERLESWHQTLITDGKELRVLKLKIDTDEATVRQLRERNENIERDVQRYHDRKRIEHEIAFLNVLIPLQAYREIRTEYQDAKALQRVHHNRVTRLQQKNKPAHAFLQKLERQFGDLHNERETAKKALRAAIKQVETKTASSDKLENDAEEVQSKLANLKKVEKARQAAIKNHEADIVKFTEQIEKASEVKMEKEADVQAERNKLIAEYNAGSNDGDMRRCEQSMNDVKHRKSQNQRREEAAQRELKSLDDAGAVKLQNLIRWDRDVGEAVRWLRNNKAKFKMEVFEPPVLSVTVPNKAFATLVENCFGGNQMKMFVCQCQEDYNTLNHHINDNPGLGRKAHIPTWCRPGSEADLAPPPMNREELKARGFDGYALDFVECPDGLKWYLQKDLNMHRTAISLKGIKDVQGAIEAVSRGSTGANFMEYQTIHQVQRSKYGRKEVMSTTNRVRPGRNFSGNTQVNTQDKQRIDGEVAMCKQEMRELVETDRELGEEYSRLKEIKKQHETAKEAFTERLKKIQNFISQKRSIERKLESAKQKLEEAKSKGDTVQQAAHYRAKILDFAKKRVIYVTEAVELARQVIDEQVKVTNLGLQYLQIGAKKAALKELVDQRDQKHLAAVAEYNKANEKFAKLKERSKEIMAESKEVLANLPAEMSEEYQRMEAARGEHETAVKEAVKAGREPPQPGDDVDMRTTVQLQAELEKQQADLEMNMNTNPGVVEQYEKRKRDIEQHEKSIEGMQNSANKIERKIKIARDNWEPALQALVKSIGEKFSQAFDRIGCAGEIRIRPEEAYENWAIDILVKFRDTEKLQLLTGQRQSGGERSLTTILYLMSLTEEARAPFSLVDEINQGMDQRAERMVHNSMVNVTCKDDSAQYFLITPKLLPDLTYHRRMKVLCVNNGEWLPDEGGLGNMMNMIDAYVAKNPRRQQ